MSNCLVKALKDFSSTTMGNVSSGKVFDMPFGLAVQFEQSGLVDIVKKKELTAKGGQIGEVKQSQSSQAVQASQKNSVKKSEEEDGKQSPSTQASRSLPGQTSSMDAIGPGGKSITKKRRGRPKGGQAIKK